MADPLSSRGEGLAAIECLQEARRQFEKLVEIDPGRDEYRTSLAQIDKVLAALQAAQEAKATNP
jgi:hypothetical protein